MFKSGQVLKSPYDFDNAMFFGADVSVWQNENIIDYGGKILANTDDSILINDGRYLKAVCEFKVR
jgi:hypothetical protein